MSFERLFILDMLGDDLVAVYQPCILPRKATDGLDPTVYVQ